MQLKVEQDYKDQRLDKFLVEKFPQISRSQLQKAIKAEKVLVNNKKAAKHYFLNTNDVIDINLDLKEQQKNEFILQPNKNIKLDIIFEDENYLVVNKPTNLAVHPGTENNTLINGVLAHYSDITNVGENSLRPGIVHRLDKDVSGVMVIAKTQAAFLNLKKQFQDRKVYKEYISLVHGKPSRKHDFIKFNIERSKTSGYKMAAKPDETGKEAVTEYNVIEEYNNYSLLKVIIHTGRTHQIRVHLNAIGHPVVGDQIYRPKSLKTRIKLDRIFLHAHVLKFKNLEKETLEFKQDLPEELDKFLNSISLSFRS